MAALSSELGEGGPRSYAYRYIGNPDRAMIGVVLDPDDKGVRLSAVTPDGPAARAGLRDGDIITAIDHQPVVDKSSKASYEKALTLLANLKAGQNVSINYLRGNDTGVVTVAAERREAWNWPMLINDDPKHSLLPKDFDERMRAEIERAQREAERTAAHDKAHMQARRRTRAARSAARDGARQGAHAGRRLARDARGDAPDAHDDAVVGPQPRAAERRSRPLLRHRQGRARDRGRPGLAARHPRRRRHHQHRRRAGQSSRGCAARAARSGHRQGRRDQAAARPQDARAQHEGACVQVDLRHARRASGSACAAGRACRRGGSRLRPPHRRRWRHPPRRLRCPNRRIRATDI